MEKGQVAGFAGQLDKVFALVDKGAASTGLCPLGMLGEVAGDVSKGIAGDKGAAGPRGRVGPLDHGEQGLFGAVEEVLEETAVLVPAGGVGRGGSPGLVGAVAEVDNKGVGPFERLDRRKVNRFHASHRRVDAVFAA